VGHGALPGSGWRRGISWPLGSRPASPPHHLYHGRSWLDDGKGTVIEELEGGEPAYLVPQHSGETATRGADGSPALRPPAPHPAAGGSARGVELVHGRGDSGSATVTCACHGQSKSATTTFAIAQG
jgi:hypothetical protein